MPATTSTRRRRSSRQAAAVPATAAKGARTVSTDSRRDSGRTGRRSRAYPASGTTLVSIPREVPAKVTVAAGSRSTIVRARARPGTTWPPVPPAATSTRGPPRLAARVAGGRRVGSGVISVPPAAGGLGPGRRPGRVRPRLLCRCLACAGLVAAPFLRAPAARDPVGGGPGNAAARRAGRGAPAVAPLGRPGGGDDRGARPPRLLPGHVQQH